MVIFYTYLEMYLPDLGKSISLSEFEDYFKTPHQTIKKHLYRFHKILEQEKRERFLFYKLKKENPLVKEYLSMCEKERLIDFLEKNTLFGRLYNELSPFFVDSKILIFGSSIGRKDYKDIDILIISQNRKIRQVLKKFQDTYSVSLHMIQTKEKNLTKTFIQEIRQKHIIFNEHDYFIEVLYK